MSKSKKNMTAQCSQGDRVTSCASRLKQLREKRKCILKMTVEHSSGNLQCNESFHSENNKNGINNIAENEEKHKG